MKILILGAKGMLGNELAKVFSSGNELVLWDREELDITDKKEVDLKITQVSPDVVINSAAYTAVDDAESNKEIVYKINGEAVGYIAEVCKKLGCKMVHFSTDYVFDGEKSSGYEEDYSEKNPATVYGSSKKIAEENIIRISPEFYLVRTQWLFGSSGKNFIETMLRIAGEGKDLRVVNDQIGSPTYAKDLAEKIREMIDADISSGIYHVTNSESCSWYEFALEIFKLSGLNPKVTPVSSDEFPTPAKRPKYSVLINTKLSPMRSWRDALREYLVETGRI